MESNEKRLFLLDAYALIFRGYYAFIKTNSVKDEVTVRCSEKKVTLRTLFISSSLPLMQSFTNKAKM